MSDQEGLQERPAMTLQSAALVYAGLLIVWLGMLKLAMSTDPPAMKMPRKISAPRTPKNSTRCWYSRGTAK